MILMDLYFMNLKHTKQKKDPHHIVNLAMAIKICVKCMNILDAKKRCPNCQILHKFYTIEDFMKWSVQQFAKEQTFKQTNQRRILFVTEQN